MTSAGAREKYHAKTTNQSIPADSKQSQTFHKVSFPHQVSLKELGTHTSKPPTSEPGLDLELELGLYSE